MSETRDFKHFTEVDELANWLVKEKDIIISTNEAELVLGYLEGHDFGVGTDRDNNLVVKDIATLYGEMFDYTFNEVVDRVLEWNYELLTYNEKCYEEENMSFRDTIACKNKIASLREDEKVLDALSNRLQYNKKVKDFVNDVKTESKAEKSSEKELNEKSVNLIHNIIKKQKKGR